MQYHNDSNECRHGQNVGHICTFYIFGKVYCDISHSTSQQNFYANKRAEDDLVKYIESKNIDVYGVCSDETTFYVVHNIVY